MLPSALQAREFGRLDQQATRTRRPDGNRWWQPRLKSASLLTETQLKHGFESRWTHHRLTFERIIPVFCQGEEYPRTERTVPGAPNGNQMATTRQLLGLDGQERAWFGPSLSPSGHGKRLGGRVARNSGPSILVRASTPRPSSA
jgi:hypothetical protein